MIHILYHLQTFTDRLVYCNTRKKYIERMIEYLDSIKPLVPDKTHSNIEENKNESKITFKTSVDSFETKPFSEFRKITGDYSLNLLAMMNLDTFNLKLNNSLKFEDFKNNFIDILRNQNEEEFDNFKKFYTTKKVPLKKNSFTPLKTLTKTHSNLKALYCVIKSNLNLLNFILNDTVNEKCKKFLESSTPEKYLESNELTNEDYLDIYKCFKNVHPLLEPHLRDYSPVKLLTTIFFSKLKIDYKEFIYTHHMINSEGICIPSSLKDFKSNINVYGRYVLSPKIKTTEISRKGGKLSIKTLISTKKLDKTEKSNLEFNRPVFIAAPPFLIIDLLDTYKGIHKNPIWKMNKLIIPDSLIIKSILEVNQKYSVTGILIRETRGVLNTPNYLPIIKEGGKWNLDIMNDCKKFFRFTNGNLLSNHKYFSKATTNGNKAIELEVHNNTHFIVEAVFYTRN